MTAAIKKEKPKSFGLWYECPDEATVAWGARGIADPGRGFSTLPDRQTTYGSPEDFKAFSALLNDGRLKAANEHCKRLREGYSPWKDLSQGEFAKFWDGLREDPEHKDAIEASVYSTNPHGLWRDLHGEDGRAEAHFEVYRRKCEAFDKNTPPPPGPPSRCEGEICGDQDDEDDDEDCDCNREFKKISRTEYEGCTFDDESACWICDDCNFYHDVSDDWGPSHKPLPTPILDSVKRIVGYREQQMFRDKAEVFTLFEDDKVVIKGNTNGSHGYVYLIAYPKE